MRKLNKKSFSLELKDSLKGYIFLIPLLVGLVYFFLIPIVQSFIFSIGDITTGSGGYNVKITGFSAYHDALYDHTSYRQTVVEAIWTVIKNTPFILIFSFFIASILNQDFAGKMIFRVILFIPAVTSLKIGRASCRERV